MATQRKVLVWGAGGHGRVVADLAQACGWELAGFIDRLGDKVGEVVPPFSERVLYSEADFEPSAPLPDAASAVALGIGNNELRIRALELLDESCAPALIHPRAIISQHCVVGAGTIALAGSVINAGAAVGRAVIVNTAAVIEHDCVVSDGAHISPGAVLAGGVHVGPLAWIGANATVLPGLTLGAGAIVGAGAVVRYDVPSGACVVGNPAKPIERAR